MRPLIIKFQAFGPYKNEEIIDFEKISKQGIFLICGETGSGKTTILDAITFALFGKSSGGMRDQLEAMRCKQSEWGTDTYVSFDFELMQKTYRFERRLECKKVKLSSSQNVYLKNEEGIFEPIFENCKEKDINAKAKELLGLDYEQFRQVIILPQGQFEKLLTSNSDEKEKILVSIFGVNKWQKIANYFYEYAAENRSRLVKIKEQVEVRLEEEGCKSLEEFENQIAELQLRKQKMQEQFLKTEYDTRKKQLEEQREIGKQFAAMHALENRLQELEKKREQFEIQKQRLQQAERAEMVRPVLRAFEEVKEEYAQKNKRQALLEKEIARVKEEAELAKRKLNTHLEQKAQVEQMKEEIIRLEEKRPFYQGMSEKQASLEREMEVFQKQDRMKEKKNFLYKKADESLKQATEKYQMAYEVYTIYSQRYISGITGTLAARLKDGDACPVCGSTSHPWKAKEPEVYVSEAEVKQKEQEMSVCFQNLSERQKEREAALKEKEKQETICADQEKRLVFARAEIENARANLVDGISCLQELHTILTKYQKELESYQKTVEYLEMVSTKKKEQFAELQTKWNLGLAELESLVQKMKYQKELFEQTMKEAEFASPEEVKNAVLPVKDMQRIRDIYAKYQAEIKHICDELQKERKMLQGVDEPELRRIEEAQKALEEEKEEYFSNLARLDLAMKQKSEKREQLEKLAQQYAASWKQAEADFALAKNLRGDTGIGLQRYVLGVMFSSVIVAANKMLEKVHGGRYRLFRSDEKGHGSNKKGLELKVFDSYSRDGDEGRSVKTLSGGEKFLVSLALSIGMSTVAQRSGTHLDAMFVDEGFGSLDQNSIEDALEVLASIQRANGMVGIISHVQVLQDNIPAKLEIKKGKDGSRIVMNIG